MNDTGALEYRSPYDTDEANDGIRFSQILLQPDIFDPKCGECLLFVNNWMNSEYVYSSRRDEYPFAVFWIVGWDPNNQDGIQKLAGYYFEPVSSKNQTKRFCIK